MGLVRSTVIDGRGICLYMVMEISFVTMLLAAVLTCLSQIAGQGDVHLLGPQVSSFIPYKQLDGARKVFLLTQEFPQRASVFGFVGFFKNTNAVRFQVWRDYPNVANTYTLVYETRFSISNTSDLNTRHVVKLEGSAPCFLVLPRDRIAFMNEQDVSPIGYLFDTTGVAVQFYSINSTFPELNEPTAFDTLNLPYEFALSVAVDEEVEWYDNQSDPNTCRPGLEIPPEPTTTTSTMPPSTTPDLRGPAGPKGEKGDRGPQGIQGIKGDQGPQGEPGLNGTQGEKGDKGPKGDKGDQGQQGAVGPEGIKGDRGDRGDRGEKGDRGEPGPPGREADPASTTQDDCKCGEGLLNSNLILGLIVWLLLLTLFVILLLILITRVKKQEVPKNSLHSYGGRGRDNTAWLDGMRDEEWKNYTNDTISR